MKSRQHPRRAVAFGVRTGVRAAKLAVAAGPAALFLAPLGVHLIAFAGLATNLDPRRIGRMLPARALARLPR